MSNPVIFISAVSRELRSVRGLVAKTLLALGYEPRWQNIASTEAGDIRAMLRKWVDGSDAVIQLVGHCYGFSPQEPDPDPAIGLCSYTQYEALYARQKGKPVYYILIEASHPKGGCGCKPRPKALHRLQQCYRQRIQDRDDIYYQSCSYAETELLIRRMDDKLAELRKQEQALAEHQRQKIDHLTTQNEKLLQAMRELPQALSQRLRGDAAEDEATRTARAYTLLEAQLKLPAGTLDKELPALAQRLLQREETSALDRANALFSTQKFAEAEAEALAARDLALGAAGPPVQDAISALLLAGESAEAQIHYAHSMEHYRAAAALTSPLRNVLQWLEVQNKINWLYYLQGRYPEALVHSRQVWEVAGKSGEKDAVPVLVAHMNHAKALDYNRHTAAAVPEYRAVLRIMAQVLGAEHPDTLTGLMNLADALDYQGKPAEAEEVQRELLRTLERVSDPGDPKILTIRSNLAVTLNEQGRDAEAEQEHRAVLQLREGRLGAEHPETLSSRNNLAISLNKQGRHDEAEREHRAVLSIRERVLGVEHPETLKSRTNLAVALHDLGRHHEAEREHRAVLSTQERVLGGEHPETLESRNNLAIVLDAQGRHVEAEREHRLVSRLRKTHFGEEHPQVARSYTNLALCLAAQGRLPESLQFMLQAEHLLVKVLGSRHPDSRNATTSRELIEDMLKRGM